MTHLSEEKISEIWADKNTFTLNQTAALWVGEAPPLGWHDDPDDPNYDPDNLPTSSFRNVNAFEKILLLLQNAVGNGNGEKGKLKVKYFYPDKEYDDAGPIPGSCNENFPHPENTIVTRLDLTEWAESNGFFPLFLFSKAVKNHRRTNLITSCLDKDHKYYSRELAIAIEAWHYFYNEENISNIKGHGDQILAWLEKHYSAELLKIGAKKSNATDRIITMINRNKQKNGR